MPKVSVLGRDFSVPVWIMIIVPVHAHCIKLVQVKVCLLNDFVFHIMHNKLLSFVQGIILLRVLCKFLKIKVILVHVSCR